MEIKGGFPNDLVMLQEDLTFMKNMKYKDLVNIAKEVLQYIVEYRSFIFLFFQCH